MRVVEVFFGGFGWAFNCSGTVTQLGEIRREELARRVVRKPVQLRCFRYLSYFNRRYYSLST
jgi:hypothetical protein